MQDTGATRNRRTENGPSGTPAPTECMTGATAEQPRAVGDAGPYGGIDESTPVLGGAPMRAVGDAGPYGVQERERGKRGRVNPARGIKHRSRNGVFRMRVIFTCGGTAGHVNPALALAGLMRQRDPQTAVLFVGTPDGMERELVAKAGYDYAAVEVDSFRRSMRPEAMRHNLHAAGALARSGPAAKAILREFRPDLVVGTGGYASFPMVKAAARAHIPTAVHESNSVPGLTTRMLEEYADVIMVGFEDCRQHYRHPERIMVTGTPVRGDFFEKTPLEARQNLAFDDGRPVVVSFWGSLGASHMNEAMLDMFEKERENGFPFHHVHAVGKSGWETMETALRQRELALCPDLDVRQYIYNMATVMRAADLVICRAGASTISELTALGMPAIMVPSPYVTNNHQEKNARLLEAHGGARVLLESEANGAALYDSAADILRSPETQARMKQGMAQLGIPDAAERIYDTVMALVR